MPDSPHPILEVRNVSCVFRSGSMLKPHFTRAVDDVSIVLRKGETVAVVGESGSGKTTLSLMMLGLQAPTSGAILMDGKPLTSTGAYQRAKLMQPIFQDPYASLNPRQTVAAILETPLSVHGTPRDRRRARIREIMDCVGLPQRLAASYPNQLSGGQRQRVAIARALMLSPKVLICDEPTSALDVSVQSQILNLLTQLKRELGLTYLFISHNIAVVEHMASRICVMRHGKIVESANSQELLYAAKEPYTRALLAAVLTPDPDLGLPNIAEADTGRSA